VDSICSDGPITEGKLNLKGLQWEAREPKVEKSFVINGHTLDNASLSDLSITLSYASPFKQFVGVISKSSRSEATDDEVQQSINGGKQKDGSYINVQKNGDKNEFETHVFVFVAIPRSKIPASK
jgi:hypothetical protein